MLNHLKKHYVLYLALIFIAGLSIWNVAAFLKWDKENVRPVEPEKMIEMGLIDEVRRYYEIDNPITASQAIGCKELKPYIDGVDDLNNCIERLKQATRRYIKRQLTWFRRNRNIHWLTVDRAENFDSLLRESTNFIQNCDII